MSSRPALQYVGLFWERAIGVTVRTGSDLRVASRILAIHEMEHMLLPFVLFRQTA